MPAVLTHKAIMLLARDRLAHLHSITGALIERKTLAGTPISAMEQKVHRLSGDAAAMMSSGPTADVRTPEQRDGIVSGQPDLLNSVSKFAVMGSMGPDLPAFAEVFNPGQGWSFDTIHKGTPDYNREQVVAGTSDMALSFYINAWLKIRETVTDADVAKQEQAQNRELAKARAYILGHLCHLAGDIVSHPFINDLEWHLEADGQDPLPHSDNEKVIDSFVAKRFFRVSGVREGQNWGGWWPSEDEVPGWFFDAYVGAFESTYGDGEDRVKGFRDFEEDLAAQNPPPLTADFMRYGYKTYRGMVLGSAYSWGFWTWFGMLLPLFLPMMFAPLISYAMPHSRTFFVPEEDEPEGTNERRAFELMTLPLQMGAFPALIYGASVFPFAERGAGDRALTGILTQTLSLFSLVPTIIEATEVDTPQDGLPAWARWLIMFIIPAAIDAGLGIVSISDATEESEHPRPYAERAGHRRKLLGLINAIPLVCLVVFFLLLIVPFLIARAVADEDTSFGLDTATFWGIVGTWMAAMLGLWIGLPFALRDSTISENVEGDEFPLQRHAVRLFDDTTLHQDPTLPDRAAFRYYPSDLRPLAKLWWTGAGDMQIRSDRFGLTFRIVNGGAPQTVPGPMSPVTVTQYLQQLRETVLDGASATGSLQGAVLFEEDIANYTLPTGAVFAAHGDFKTNEADIVEASAEFIAMGTTEEDGFVLYHAPKPMQAIHMGPGGPFRPLNEAARRAAEVADGYSYVVDPILEEPRHSDALMARAADLGALLCMGAVDHISDTPVVGDRVYQVFRNWSLDRRRVNEWKMLVTGGAVSEKPDGAEKYDDAMPQGLNAPSSELTRHFWESPIVNPGDATALTEADETSRGHGWVETLRDWVRAVEEGEDILATTPIRPGGPSNRAVSRAMAYLLDANDPAGP